MNDIYGAHVKDAEALYTALREDQGVADAFKNAGDVIVSALKEGHTLFIAGNGGSAGEAQHLAAELTGRYKKERRALPAIALTTDTSALTAIGNDYSFEEVFARQLEALAKPGDVLLVLSTSGSSPNILRAIEKAKTLQVHTVGWGGKNGGTMKTVLDYVVIVPSDDTPRIQEVHLLFMHALSERIEAEVV